MKRLIEVEWPDEVTSINGMHLVLPVGSEVCPVTLLRAIDLEVTPGGTLKGTLPCGHDVKWLEVHVLIPLTATEGESKELPREAYCTKCWNAEEVDCDFDIVGETNPS